MAVTRLSGGLTPANGSDPRTFPAIWNATADDIEAAESNISTLQGNVSQLQTDVGNVEDQTVRIYDDATARDAAITAPAEGMVVYLKDNDQLQKYTGAAWRSVTSFADMPTGSVIQVVTATDATNRSTSSGTMVDGGISVSITPLKASSKLLVTWSGLFGASAAPSYARVNFQLTDSSNNALSGAEYGIGGHETSTGFASWNGTRQLTAFIDAVDTASRTYKLRYSNSGNGVSISNSSCTGRMIVMEIAA